jgi:hypothetical protein
MLAPFVAPGLPGGEDDPKSVQRRRRVAMKYVNILEDINNQLPVPARIEFFKSSKAGGKAYQVAGGWLVRVPPPVDYETLFTGIHELGHTVNSHWRLSCLREYYAEMFAMQCFKRLNLPVTKDIESHHKWYMAFSLGQALNRGLKRVPAELKPYRKYLHKTEKLVCDGGSWKRISRYHAFVP